MQKERKENKGNNTNNNENQKEKKLCFICTYVIEKERFKKQAFCKIYYKLHRHWKYKVLKINTDILKSINISELS